MRRHFFGSSFIRQAFRNELKFSTVSASVSSSNARETTMEGVLKGSEQKTKSSPSRNPRLAAMIETAAIAMKDAADALAAIRREFVLDVRDETLPDGQLYEASAAARAEDDSYKKIRLQNVLTEFHTRFQEIELEKDRNDRKKLPLALPDVEIESKRIADLSIEEPLIIFVAASFNGENGQVTGTSSHAELYTDNKGLPLQVGLGRDLNDSRRTGRHHALEYTVLNAPTRFASLRYKIFSDDKYAVKNVQEIMLKLKAGEKVPNGTYTTIANTLIANDSTIEFIASEGNVIACFLADMIGKVGHPLLEVHNLVSDEAQIVL